MRRALALVAAVAMVVGALWWKGVIGGGSDGAGDGTADGPVRLLCATELAAACEQLDALDEVEVVRTENPGTTADALAAGESAGWDVWLVSEPWAAMAGVPTGDPLASAALQVAVADLSTITCEPAANAVCWGKDGLRVGIGPGSTTAGALAAVAVAGDVAGRAVFATNDYEEVDLRSRLEAIDATAPLRTDDPVSRLLTARGSFDVAVGLAIRVPEAQADRVVIVDVAPPRQALAVMATRSGSPDVLVERIGADQLRDAFEAAGWTPVTGAAPASGLPRPAVIDAVAALWDEVRR